MKRLLLTLPILCCTYLLQAQNCNQIAESKIKKIEEAVDDAEYYNLRAYDSLRKEMSATFDILESCVARNPSFEARAKMKKIRLYFTLSGLAGEVGKYNDMLKNIEAMERLLPSPSAISASSAASFTIDGSNFTASITASDVSAMYYEIIEQRAHYYYFSSFNYAKVIEWYKKLENAPSDFKPASLEALLYADALYKSGKTTPEYFPAMAKAVSAFGPQWAKKEEHDSSMINNRSLMVGWFKREMNYNKAELNNADPNGKWRIMAARGLWDSNEKELAKDYALSAAQNGASDLADGFWYLDIVSNGEAKHEIGALLIIEHSVNSLSESEMDRILKLAQKHNMTSLENAIKGRLRKIASLRRRSTISLYPAVELVGLPCGHIPVSLNLRTGRVLQEFMFDYVWHAKTRYRFGRIFDKGEKGNRYQFSGWDAGYTISVIVGNEFKQGNRKKGRSRFFSPAIGLDFRYANWNLDALNSDILDDNDNVLQSNVRVNAKTNRYEICFRTNFITMTRFATIEYFLGLGIGYRNLSTAEGYNVETTRFRDARLKEERWNKLYMPLRFGIKIGLNIL